MSLVTSSNFQMQKLQTFNGQANSEFNECFEEISKETLLRAEAVLSI